MNIVASNRRQVNVTCKMLTAVTHDQSMELKVTWMLLLESVHFSKFAFILLCYGTNHLK